MLRQARHKSQASWVSLDLEDIGLEPASEHNRNHACCYCQDYDHGYRQTELLGTFRLASLPAPLRRLYARRLAHLQQPMNRPTAELGRCAPPFSRGSSDAGAAISAKGAGAGLWPVFLQPIEISDISPLDFAACCDAGSGFVLQVVRTFNYQASQSSAERGPFHQVKMLWLPPALVSI